MTHSVGKRPIPHGTVNGYDYHKCRCPECRAAKSGYQRAHPRRPPKKPIPHGTITGYASYRCRCSDCQMAIREYEAKRRKSSNCYGNSVAVSGRVLQAKLDASGMTIQEMATHIGLGEQSLHRILRRGTAGFYTLDKIACALGCHMSEFLTDPKIVYGWEVTGSDLGED